MHFTSSIFKLLRIITKFTIIRISSKSECPVRSSSDYAQDQSVQHIKTAELRRRAGVGQLSIQYMYCTSRYLNVYVIPGIFPVLSLSVPPAMYRPAESVNFVNWAINVTAARSLVNEANYFKELLILFFFIFFVPFKIIALLLSLLASRLRTDEERSNRRSALG